MIYSYDLTNEQTKLMKAKSVITAKDVQALVDNHPRIVAGKNVMMQKYGYLAPRMVPNFRLACVRIKNEYVAEYKNSVLKNLENKYVFIGVLKEQSLLNELTFVWLPLWDLFYVVDDQPFEIIERPKLFLNKKKVVYDFFSTISYDRGKGYCEVDNKNYPIVQRNYLKREFAIKRNRIAAVADLVNTQFDWVGFRVNESFTKSYEPMWLLRNEPEKCSCITTIRIRQTISENDF